MAATTPTPPTSGTGSTLPPSMRNDFSKNANDPALKQDPKKEGAKDDSGSALQKTLRQQQEVSREEAIKNRKRVAFNSASSLLSFIGTSGNGWSSFTPAGNEKALQRQIKNKMRELLKEDPTIDTFYFYKGGKEIDKQMTQVATNMLAALQSPGGEFHGCGLRVSPDKMSGVEPWRDHIFGRIAKQAENNRDAANTRKAVAAANKL